MSYYCCDYCLRIVHAKQVADFADYEHVICKRCMDEQEGKRL